jgi:DUF1680 family protein
LLASLERYLYGTGENELYVNQYVSSTATTSIDDTAVEITQDTDLPWSGSVTIDVAAAESLTFDVHLRVPDWCSNASVTVNGTPITVEDDGYVTIERAWEADTIEAQFEQEITPVRSHPAVAANANRVALTRGPLVYCLEGVDHDRPLHHFAVDPEGTFEATYRDDLLGGVVTIKGEARVPAGRSWDGDLYLPDAETDSTTTRFTAVPYYAWDNRESGEMRVWLHAT